MATTTCIFDGAHPTTNAHIFPQGLGSATDPWTKTFATHQSRDEPGSSFDVTRTSRTIDAKVKCACQPLQRRLDGIGGKLDRQAEDLFLTDAAHGYDVKLDKMADKAALARWCALILALSDQTQQTKRLDSSVHNALFEGRVPTGSRSGCSGQSRPPGRYHIVWSSVKHQKLPSAQATMEAQTVTFGVMHLVVQTLLPTAGSTPGMQLYRRGDEAFVRQLQPDPMTPFNWPPPATIAWNDALKLPDAFDV